MIKKIKSWLNIFILTIILIVPGLVFANPDDKSVTGRLHTVAVTNGPFSTADGDTLATTLGIVIKAALSLLGVIFLVITVLAGFKWMTAQGDEGKVKEAKESMQRAIIGLLVTISAWAIWYFISINFISKV